MLKRAMLMRQRIPLLALLLAAGSCSDLPTTAPPSPVPQPSPQPQPSGRRVLGEMLVKFSVTGPGEVRASASTPPSGSFSSGARFALVPTSEGAGAATVAGIVGEFLDGAGSFTYGAPGAPGSYRYLFATLTVRNAGVNSAGAEVAYTTPRPNLTVIATAVPSGFAGGIAGTAFASPQKFDGTPADPAIAAGIMPTGAVRQTLTGGITTHSPDVLQVFTEDELAPLIAAGYDPFPYGYVVRHKTLTNTRTLAANPGPNQYDGLITFGIKIPLQANPADDIYGFSMFFVVVDDSDTRVTQSIEEQDAAGQAAFEARVAALTGVNGVTLLSGGSYGGSVAPVRVLCGVRTAGTAAAPVTFLGDPNSPGPCLPTLTSVTPASGLPGNTVSVTLAGTRFVSGATTVAVSGTGVTVSNVNVASATSLTADFVIAAGAATTARNVTVTTAGGTSGARTFTVAPPPPTLTGITPNAGMRGEGPIAVTLTGTNFVIGGTTVAVSGGADMFVDDVVVTSTTQLTANFFVHGAAATGARNVTVTTGGGTSGAQTFTVNPGLAVFDVPGDHGFVVPFGVTSITIQAAGAQGGAGFNNGGAGANGGSVTATVAVTEFEPLVIFVGSQGGAGGNGSAGSAGFNGGAAGGSELAGGGGGGGASDVRQGGAALENQIVVAGGGGGGGGDLPGGGGGAGGATTGGAGGAGSGGAGGAGGGGGTGAAGGAGGADDGVTGSPGNGGAGGNGFDSGGGGGGGYYGGGGGGATDSGDGGGGGGGGSSFTGPGATSVSHTQGNRAGHGRVIITW